MSDVLMVLTLDHIIIVRHRTLIQKDSRIMDFKGNVLEPGSSSYQGSFGIAKVNSMGVTIGGWSSAFCTRAGIDSTWLCRWSVGEATTAHSH